MYERFFHLRERPFSLSPDPEYMYPSRVHTEALNYLRYGIEGHAGFIVITGEIGSGKTTLLQTALRGVHKSTAVSRIVNTMLDARDLIEAVMLDFDLDPPPDASKPRLLRSLSAFLVDERRAGRIALLVIDEAQNLSLAALEEVRMLSNLETEKSKLIQIALVGQPDLRARMACPELEQLRQRVTVSYHLPALDLAETDAYINYRLSRAALSIPPAFPREVTELVHRHSQGVPRRINVIADAILLYAYGEGLRTIDRAVAEGALSELRTSGILPAEALPAEAISAATAPHRSAPLRVTPPPAPPFDSARVVNTTPVRVAAPVAAAISHAPVINRERSWPTAGRVLVAPTPGRMLVSPTLPPRESMWTRFTRGLFSAMAADWKL